MGRRSGGRAGGSGRQRVEGERVEVMVGGREPSYDPPGCLIWGAVETLGWAASAKSKQNG